MRANSKAIQRFQDKAEVGIGTMIVFIATVLVAAIAAAVLIDTSGKLQERSTRTGQQTTEQVASNVQIESIVGKRNATSAAGLNETEVYITLAPGASTVDLKQLRIHLFNGTKQTVLEWSGTNLCTATATGCAANTAFATDTGAYVNATKGKYNATAVRDADGSFSFSSPVMNAGDMVKITLSLWKEGRDNNGHDDLHPGDRQPRPRRLRDAGHVRLGHVHHPQVG